MPLALRRVSPPRLGRITCHKSRDRHENVDYTRVMARCGLGAQPRVQIERALAYQLAWRVDAQQAKVCSDRFANVGQIGERG